MAALQQEGAPRHQRADAARNRQRLLAAADEVFRERGLEVGVGEIAERAGVGRGTLFRNFPTKQDLIIAVVLDRFEQEMTAGRARLQAAGDEEILFPFIRELVGQQQDNKGLFEAVGEEAFLTDERMQRAHAEMIELLDALIDHDHRLGFVRDGLGAGDILMLFKGACAVAAAMPELGPAAIDRHLSLVRGAILAPGRECPLEGSSPTFEHLGAAPQPGAPAA